MAVFRVAMESLFVTLLLTMILTFCCLYLEMKNYNNSSRKRISDYEIRTETTDSNLAELHNDKKRNTKKVLEATKPKLILIYSTLFDQATWADLNHEQIKTFMNRCDYSNCKITYDKNLISTADALLFHGVDVMNNKAFAPNKLFEVAKKKPLDQKWVFFIQESPDNYPNFENYAGLFDWQMSYKFTSEILVPYGHYKLLDAFDKISINTVNYAERKSKLAIWFVSNCGHTRDKYIKELRNYMPITVGGTCAKDIFGESIRCDRGSNACVKEIQSHKFFLAFENSFCDYYVSEKYWRNGIDLGLVPVVMGARYDVTNVIPGSYIDASKFRSIKKLAAYLLYLDDNDKEYNKYFSWKVKYKRIGYEKMCELCKTLHTNKVKDKPYKNIWSQENDCKQFQWKNEYMKTLERNSKKMRKRNITQTFK